MRQKRIGYVLFFEIEARCYCETLNLCENLFASYLVFWDTRGTFPTHAQVHYLRRVNRTIHMGFNSQPSFLAEIPHRSLNRTLPTYASQPNRQGSSKHSSACHVRSSWSNKKPLTNNYVNFDYYKNPKQVSKKVS